MDSNSPWFSLIAGIGMILGSLLTLPEDGGSFHGFPIPAVGGWILLVIGAIWCVLSVKLIRKRKRKSTPPEYTNEDVTKGLSELERMYVKDHGTLPEYPDEAPFDAKTEKKE